MAFFTLELSWQIRHFWPVENDSSLRLQSQNILLTQHAEPGYFSGIFIYFNFIFLYFCDITHVLISTQRCCIQFQFIM